MATGARKSTARVAQERARLYQARQEYQAGLVRRRKRDNLIALVGGGLLVLAIIGGQVAYFTAGPGTPTPAPTQTGTPTPEIDPTQTGAPTPTPTD